ncbi:SDR family NAD(P)-dependent oxidoreductase [Spirosoma endbachense]|uniref:SDR family NAD(P)-dependent oxidoreductase n=1 Tax=Spirosoma endbachense TaxID=2666025 RepID=A0A6P1VV22_9BACT|nr:SDR family NAD(P)-dependent oxidoreductase [Spirosoma endbachense]QHV95922.1 SDR family NAD(P)-dependent oxidoreductase [Spirosoma endbachense]
MKVLSIIGVGPGISLAVARRFAREGFAVALISRNRIKLEGYIRDLKADGIEAAAFQYDSSDSASLETALKQIEQQLGPTTVLHYNAASLHNGSLEQETADSLIADFRVNTANVVAAVNAVRGKMVSGEGGILLTGGGLAYMTATDYLSLTLGKAATVTLANLLNKTLKPAGIFVGTVTVSGSVHPTAQKHTPDNIAEEFWKLYSDRSTVEVRF